MNRRDLLRALGGALAAPSTTSPLEAPTPAPSPSAASLPTIEVPFDHDRPGDGTFSLPYIALGAFDAKKPTVIVVSDGQQFFVGETSFAPSLGPLFDERFNVVAAFGRGTVAALQQRYALPNADVDWNVAYRSLQARQWIGDVEALRAHLLGPEGKALLFGRSGGAMMVHQYMARYGKNVAGVLVQASVDPYLEAAFDLESDHFWDEISASDRITLTLVLEHNPHQRETIVSVFQRQNFFVGRASLAAQRHDLIAALFAGDQKLLDLLVREYQVAAIRQLQRSAVGPAIAVRLFELEAPFEGRYDFARGKRLYPDHEAAFVGAAPLFAAARAGTLAYPTFDHAPLHELGAQVVMLAARFDHTCDYRSQLALASCYPASTLRILDDDHQFHALVAGGKAKDVTLGALSPAGSAAYANAMQILDGMRYREGRA